MIRKAIYITTIAAILLLISCKVNYSFTGASIPEDVKTVSVKTFQSYAPLANANLTQSFTEALKDIFITQTNLNLVTRDGDLQFDGAITGYSISSVAIQGNDQAALNRLSITVKVKFTNTKDSQQDFETSFTRFADYESSQNIASIEDELIKDINGQLTQDIFNKAVSNW
ncbi:MAG: LptE family protein [Flavobacteriales bacterium]|nr:LptE family protein [Flavobacteriales bacterium]